MSEVAGAFGIDAAQIHSSLQFLRNKRWADNAAATTLTEALSSALDALAPAAPLLDRKGTGEGAHRRHPHGRRRSHSRRARARGPRATPEPAGHLAPHRQHTVGRARSRSPRRARGAGQTADQLAVTEPLPSSEAVRSKLAEVAEGTPVATLPADQRLTLAARASANAAASARLELYPRGMDADAPWP